MFKVVVALFVTVTIVTVNARPSYITGLGLAAYGVPAGRITTASDGHGISTTVIEGPSALGLAPVPAAVPAYVALPGPISTTVIKAGIPTLDLSNVHGVDGSVNAGDGSTGDDGSNAGNDGNSAGSTGGQGGEENSNEGQEATEPSVDESTAGQAAAAQAAAAAASASASASAVIEQSPIVPVAPLAQPAFLTGAAAPNAISHNIIGTVPSTISTQSNSVIHSAALVPAAAPAAVLITKGAPTALTFAGPTGKSVAIQTSGAPLHLVAAAPNVVKVW